jgi:tetratricopeptide (TPR) repeat protein
LNIIVRNTRAGFIACLFLLFPVAVVNAQEQQWVFDETTQRAYDLVLNLQTEEAMALISQPGTAQEHYVLSLAETLELLLTEDAEKFSAYEDLFQSRIHTNIKGSSNDYKFLRAELHLHWAFVYLKFGHELDAATHLREAYRISVDCRKKSPRYLAIQKTTGLLEIIIGSVPEKYNWVLGLFHMKGTIPIGLKELDNLRNSDSPLALEADLLVSLAQGYIFQKPDQGLDELKKILSVKPENRLALFTAASLAIKNSQSEEALPYLKILTEKRIGIPFYYSDYLKGEVYLHQGDYIDAIASYRWFITHFKGQNHLKDATYKIALCYRLNGNNNDAAHFFDEARRVGKESAEADKSAGRSLSDKILPHVALSKVRYHTDGGYYAEARAILNSISDKDLPDKRSQVEYFYRKARLEHKTNQPEAAKLFYRQVIDMTGDDNWYFAPNACLQMGYILQASNKDSEARSYFQQALKYKRHEYKNSIDSKAKSALEQLKK